MDAVDAIKLSTVQFATCAVLSLIGALATEDITLVGLQGGAVSIAYGGLMSVGIAYTLQWWRSAMHSLHTRPSS